MSDEITTLHKFRAAFTTWNERTKPEYVIETTYEELYQASQVLLIKERVVILETVSGQNATDEMPITKTP